MVWWRRRNTPAIKRPNARSAGPRHGGGMPARTACRAQRGSPQWPAAAVRRGRRSTLPVRPGRRTCLVMRGAASPRWRGTTSSGQPPRTRPSRSRHRISRRLRLNLQESALQHRAGDASALQRCWSRDIVAVRNQCRRPGPGQQQSPCGAPEPGRSGGDPAETARIRSYLRGNRLPPGISGVRYGGSRTRDPRRAGPAVPAARNRSLETSEGLVARAHC